MRTILLKFAGPLQSWGTSSHFESRHTDFYPSKSGVVGLIAACLGYHRDEDEKIRSLNDLHFAVRVDQPGRLLKDYQTVHKLKKNGDFDRNYVTNRYYIEDGVFLVALGSETAGQIEEIVKALQQPYFQPFLGRRSVPPTYDFLLGVFDESPLHLLKTYPWQKNKSHFVKSSTYLPIYFDAGLGEGVGGRMRKDEAVSFSSRNRSYLFREENRLEILPPKEDVDTEDDHDAFHAIGGENVPF